MVSWQLRRMVGKHGNWCRFRPTVDEVLCHIRASCRRKQATLCRRTPCGVPRTAPRHGAKWYPARNPTTHCTCSTPSAASRHNGFLGNLASSQRMMVETTGNRSVRCRPHVAIGMAASCTSPTPHTAGCWEYLASDQRAVQRVPHHGQWSHLDVACRAVRGVHRHRTDRRQHRLPCGRWSKRSTAAAHPRRWRNLGHNRERSNH